MICFSGTKAFRLQNLLKIFKKKLGALGGMITPSWRHVRKVVKAEHATWYAGSTMPIGAGFRAHRQRHPPGVRQGDLRALLVHHFAGRRRGRVSVLQVTASIAEALVLKHYKLQAIIVDERLSRNYASQKSHALRQSLNHATKRRRPACRTTKDSRDVQSLAGYASLTTTIRKMMGHAVSASPRYVAR